jgi:hypothetical protein
MRLVYDFDSLLQMALKIAPAAYGVTEPMIEASLTRITLYELNEFQDTLVFASICQIRNRQQTNAVIPRQSCSRTHSRRGWLWDNEDIPVTNLRVIGQ